MKDEYKKYLRIGTAHGVLDLNGVPQPKSLPFNPTLDEATATAAAIILSNHVEVIRVWQRKLKEPFMPTGRMQFSVVPRYDKPTLASLLHIVNDMKRFELELSRLMLTFTEAAVRERDRVE